MAIIQNKRRPGAYINFVSSGGSVSVNDALGLPAFIVEKSWGPDDVFIEADGGTDFKALLGRNLNELKEVREAMKGSARALIYVPKYESSTKATGSNESFTATAKYAGALGNTIRVIVTEQTDDTFTVKTVFNNQTVDTQERLTTLPVSNDYVVFTGNLPLASTTLSLTGGADGTLSNSAVVNFLSGLDIQDFTHIALGTEDATAISMAVAKVRELRGLGRPVTLVTNNYTGDYEGVISVANGVTLSSGEVLAAKDTVYWLAAAQSNAGTSSMTYATYPDAIDTERKTNDEVIALLDQGQIVYVYKNNRVVIEQDINTLVTFNDTKNADFAKNKIVRTMAIIERQIKSLFEESFLGRYTNTQDGRENLKAAIITTVLDPLVATNAIAFDVDEMVISEGNAKDTVVISLPITINDAMEKLYMSVTCD